MGERRETPNRVCSMSSGDLAPALLTFSHLTGPPICLPFSNLTLHPVAYTRNLKGYP